MYKLSVVTGSGFEDANWLLWLEIPAYGSRPACGTVIRSFKTEDEARDEAAKMVVDLAQSARVVV